MPKVSVIIPVYNVEKYLRQCLDSVINQTLQDIEIICVDDGSTDRSRSILEEYQKRNDRILLLRQQNQYAGVARNNGLKVAKGEYIFFMDGDDFCSNTLLDETIELAEQTKADIVVFDHYRYDERTRKKEHKKDVTESMLPEKCRTFNYQTNPQRIMSIVNPVPWNKIIKRDFLLKWELQFEPLSSTNDITFSALAIACASKIAYLNKPLITYRVNMDNSITSTKTQKLDNVIRALESTYYKAKKFPHYNEIKISLQVFVARNLIFALNNYAGEKNSIQSNSFVQEIGKLFFGLPLFYSIDEVAINDKSLCDFIKKISEDARKNFDTSYCPDIIVSLTSYPARINTVYQAIETIIKQTLKPDRIILWLADSQFPNREKDLPKNLLSLLSEQFQIKWTRDIKSYKKLIPALEMFNDAVIITVDDDLLFDEYMVERLVKGYMKRPDCIQCHRITAIDYISIDNIKTTPDALKVYPAPTYLHKLSGGAGCLYPPGSLHADVLKEELFLHLAPSSDDIWFWLMGVLNGYKVNVVENNNPKLVYIPGTQETALYKINDQGEKLFFVHLKNILRYYPILQDVLMYEQAIFAQITDKGKTVMDIQQLNNKVLMYQRISENYENEVAAIKSSRSYRIGQLITWLPRKIKGGIRCYKEHGLHYTLRRTLVHLHLIDEKTEENFILNDTKPMQQMKNLSTVQATTTKPDASLTRSSVKRDYDFYKQLSPEKYEEELKLWFERTTKENLDLANPRTYNEKLQWMKLYDSTPLKTRLADKYLVRDWVKEKIGEEYLIPLLGVWDNFDEIDFDKLPSSFVLKANHGCGWNIIVKDKNKFDINDAKRKFDNWMQMNFAFKFGLELHYMNIPPKIIVEEYLENDNNDLYDYKVFCFNGKAENIMYLSERKQGLKMAFFDLEWNKLPFTYSFPRNEADIPKPKNLDLLIKLSEKLANGFPHVRVDFYILNDGSLKFGEMTFSSASGTCKWNPPEQNYIYGNLIQLPKKSPLPEKCKYS